MSGTIKDLNGAILGGEVRFEEWREKFVREFFRPWGIATTRKLWDGFTDEQRQMMKLLSPDAVDEVEKMIGIKEKGKEANDASARTTTK
jgi:hypothetical protein